jgi:hypothetical protein
MCWYRDVVEYTTPIIKALNGLPVSYRYHIKHGLALGKGLTIGRYQDFTKKRNQSQKRIEEKRNDAGFFFKKKSVMKCLWSTKSFYAADNTTVSSNTLATH